ncbi:cytidylate kinase, putative [Paractinoplanes atraurantiacus]|uniref:Cytidylate kinase, putative n=1 Tax=Paractinoplanes atraurantiacus TaxID=1036182 RepID=A0A285IA50_9ACTN|nr:cytidylate kinase, putative [Actinoplanes atraurantiacus]
MEHFPSVVFNGDLGSGKTTVSVMLARRLGVRRVSIGDLYRQMAAERGMTALQLNVHAELDDKVDHYVDQMQHDIASSGERLVVDSRLAWHFFAGALKVHLIADPLVAARRALGRPGDAVESYGDLDEACRELAVRSESERQRFLTRYGVDKTRLSNYDLVCDTTRAEPQEVVALIQSRAEGAAGPRCYLDPGRVRRDEATAEDGEIAVRHQAPHFFALSGGRRLREAIDAGKTLTPVILSESGG